jgi:hypothetical protein
MQAEQRQDRHDHDDQTDQIDDAIHENLLTLNEKSFPAVKTAGAITSRLGA